MFEMLPDTFIRIEIRSIGRERFDMDQPCPTAGQQCLDFFSTMNAQTIPDDQQLLAQILRQMPQKQCAILTGQRTSAFQSSELSGRGHATHHRQVLPCQQDFQQRRFAARGISSHHSWQQVEGGFVNASNHAPFATRLFLSSGQTSLRQWATSASLRRMSWTAGFCGVQSNSFSKRATWPLWYVTPNSQAMICAIRSQVQSSSRKPYSVAPCASNSGNDSNSSRVSFGVAPFRSRACKAFSPPSRTAFIHLLTAAFVTPSASAISSWAQPSFLSSIARKRRISFQSGLRISLEVIPKF